MYRSFSSWDFVVPTPPSGSSEPWDRSSYLILFPSSVRNVDVTARAGALGILCLRKSAVRLALVSTGAVPPAASGSRAEPRRLVAKAGPVGVVSSVVMRKKKAMMTLRLAMMRLTVAWVRVINDKEQRHLCFRF